jgi:hypothetical protein
MQEIKAWLQFRPPRSGRAALQSAVDQPSHDQAAALIASTGAAVAIGSAAEQHL